MEPEVAGQEITKRMVYHASIVGIQLGNEMQQHIISLDLQGTRHFVGGTDCPDISAGLTQTGITTPQEKVEHGPGKTGLHISGIENISRQEVHQIGNRAIFGINHASDTSQQCPNGDIQR